MESNYSHQHIPVNENSLTAEWVRFASKTRKSALAAVDTDGKRGMAFVADEVLVHHAESKLIRHLTDKLGAKIIPVNPLLPAVEGLTPKPGNRAKDMPLPVRLRFSTPPAANTNVHQLLQEAYKGNVSVTSQMGAGVLGLVAELASAGSQIGLNTVATPVSLPLFSAQEWFNGAGGANPFLFPAYAGKAKVAAAWQLLEAYKHFEPVRNDIKIAILDGGFWLDGFAPAIPPGQLQSDFGASVSQVNLLDEGVPAGGANPNKCEGGYNCPWHGNGTASIAAALVGNNIGSAGTGGTVAQPVLFKTQLDISEIFRCLTYCIHFGIEILNMSWSKHAIWELTFPTTAWNECFQFASDNGVIHVAAAGNDGFELPHFNTRPATRTPGTITTGWLDTDDTAHPQSNFGSSVDIWAPGTNLPVMPDENNLSGTVESGTSAAAPFVSGIIAMMLAIKPSLTTDEVKQILQDTGWTGAGKVSKGVNAYAALLAVMGGQLPDDAIEPNNTPATASLLLPSGKPNEWVPFGTNSQNMPTALSKQGDEDWYHFSVAAYSTIQLENWFYAQAGSVNAELIPDDPDNRAADDLVVYQATGLKRLTGIIAPGNYKIKISGRISLYELSVKLLPAPIKADMFEVNNSFDNATRFSLRVPGAKAPLIEAVISHGQGTYPLTIHQPADQDFFHITADPSGPLPMVVTITVSQSDQLLDITLFDNDRTVISHHSKRSVKLSMPAGSKSYLKITASAQTRYTLTIRYEIDTTGLPGPLQNGVLTPLPDPGDPGFKLGEKATHFLVDLSRERSGLNRLVFQAANGAQLRASLLNAAGKVVAEGQQVAGAMHQAIAIDSAQMPAGHYYLLLEKGSAATGAGSSLEVERLPSGVGIQ